MNALVLIGLGALLGGSRGEPPADAPVEPAVRELLPGVMVGEGFVEFRGTVCADLSHEQTPVVYLELLVTGPDSREHESLVVTTVKPSAIHAGLLAAGIEPGRPVRWEPGEPPAPAEGAPVRVEVAAVKDGEAGERVDLASWSVHQGSGKRLTEAEGWGLVFAGSVLDEAGYAADKAGTIVGLTGFGTEVVAAAWTLSPAATVDEPVWIADKARVPAFGTAVLVRISETPEPRKDTGKSAEDGPASPGDP